MRETRWSSLLCLAALVAAVAGGCETVPITGRSQLQLVSGEQEVQMGAEAYKEILAKAKISADPAANALVTRVGTRIAAATGRSDLPWEFKVIDDPQTVNAFALPGGKVASDGQDSRVHRNLPAREREGVHRLRIVDDLEFPRQVAATRRRRDPGSDACHQSVLSRIVRDLRLPEDVLVGLRAHLDFLRSGDELELGAARDGDGLAAAQDRRDERQETEQ